MACFAKKADFITIKDLLALTNSALVLEKPEILEKKIFNIKGLTKANEEDITFFTSSRYIEDCRNTKAFACFVKQSDSSYLPSSTIAIINQDPYTCFAKLMQFFYGRAEVLLEDEDRIAKSAFVSKLAKIGKNITIRENVIISKHAEIEDDVIIMPNSFIGDGVKIGKNSIIHDNCSIMFAEIGEGSIIRSGARIGTSGFGFAPDLKNGRHEYIPQVFGVKIGNFVDIGANSTIDRGCLEDTIIKDYTKIDNLVQIGHGAQIGYSNFLAGQAGISGSVKIGNGCFIGPQCGIVGHVSIADQTTLVGKSAIAQDVKIKGQTLAGIPAVEHNLWKKMHIKLKRLLKK